jgi:hypothetical protein
MKTIVIVALAATLGGCASATRGWNEQIQFDSSPTGATVRTEIIDPFCAETNCPTQPGPACVTPCVVQVARRDRLKANFTKEGFEPQVVPVDVRIAGQGVAGFAGNVLIGGAIGMVVDAASGATLEHFPNPITVVLQPIAPPLQQRPIPPGIQRQRDPWLRTPPTS